MKDWILGWELLQTAASSWTAYTSPDLQMVY